jgi:hypothetical protein
MNIYLICPEQFNYPACRIADYRKMEAFPLFVNTLARFGSCRYLFSLWVRLILASHPILNIGRHQQNTHMVY